MSANDGGKPPAAWLEQLREARHWDRLIAMAGKSLEIDPHDPATHRQIAWAYAASDRPAKMWPHVEFLLACETDDETSHHLAAVYYLETQRIKQAWPHLQTLKKFFRETLLIEPADKERQEHLLDAIRARSLLYRTLSLPYRAGRQAVKAVRERRIQALLLVLAIKFWLAFTVWALVMGVFLTPAAWIYEWLVLTEVPRARPFPRWLAPLGATLGWWLWLRMGICFVLIIGLWLTFFVEICRASLSTALSLIGLLFGVHFVVVATFVGVRRVRARIGEWQHSRKHKRETCVVAEPAVV